MKVLMLGWEYPPKISGGLGIASQGIARGLVQGGLSVDFVLPKITNEKTSKRLNLLDANDFPSKKSVVKKLLQEITEEIKFLEVGARLMPYLTFEEFERIAHQTKVIENEVTEEVILDKITLTGGYGADLLQEIAKYALAVLNVTKTREFDIIHAHDWMTFEAGVMAREASGKPLVLHVHSTEYDRSASQINPAIFEIEKRALSRADKVIAVSMRVKKQLIKNYGLDASKIEVVYNAIDAKDVSQIRPERSSKDGHKVLFVGRLTAQKGPERFLDIAIELHRQLPDIHFTIAGDGYLRETLEAKVAANNLTSAVTFTGFVDHKKVGKLMAAHDLALLPSFSEPFGLTALEVALSGTPVIVSRESGVTELVKSMKHVKYWDTYHWVNEAKSILQHRSSAAAYAKKVKSEIVRLNWKLAADEVRTIYQSLL